MRKIRWTTEAADQLETAVKHIQQDNPKAAPKVAQALIESMSDWRTSPALADRER